MRKTTVVSGASRENNTTISVILRKQREMSQTTTALYLVWTHTHTIRRVLQEAVQFFIHAVKQVYMYLNVCTSAVR